MKIAYIQRKHEILDPDVRSIVDNANVILEEYANDGLVMTIRQLYYQFVARDLFPDNRKYVLVNGKWRKDPNGTKNAEPNYLNLISIMEKARMTGMVDWDFIVDSTRGLVSFAGEDSSIERAIESLASGYTENLWETQPYHVEVWIEKDALSGVFDRPCSELHIGLFACKGYTSTSSMWRAANRLMRFEDPSFGLDESAKKKKVLILHFGDHDPSGIDMTADIERRLRTFGCQATVKRCALTKKQIDKIKPPPNPVKITDSRAQAYIKAYGRTSWEMDALSPSFFSQLVTTEVLAVRDEKLWKKALKVQEKKRKELKRISSIPNLPEFLDNAEALAGAVGELGDSIESLSRGQKRSRFVKQFVELYTEHLNR